jgi:glutathione synthase/RimK-type ligase-like ATP-grasp enzyme
MKEFNITNLKLWTPDFDHSYIRDEYKIPIEKGYMRTLIHKNKIECEKIKELYNKHNVKLFFQNYGLNVPELYYYTTKDTDITHALRKQYVAKPAHMSESDGVFINDQDFKKVDNKLRELLKTNSRSYEPKMMKETERGIIVEEYIEYDYEFKVFVLYGCPIVGDLRNGPKEWHRVDMIDRENKYFNWDKEYEVCKQIAKDLKIDFFRIDFFYNKKEDKFYAGEMAFRPSTLLGSKIEKFIMEKWGRLVGN